MEALRRLKIAGGILGFGMGGFLDGIVLHQLLQWHHFVSNRVTTNTLEGMQLNTLWDGIFHSATYLITALGLVLLWHAINGTRDAQSPRVIWGSFLAGMGILHIADSIINHWILQIHHVRDGSAVIAYDVAFFILGCILLIVGLNLAQAPQPVNQNKGKPTTR